MAPFLLRLRPRRSPRSGSAARSARAAARDTARAARSRPMPRSRSAMRCRRGAIELGQRGERGERSRGRVRCPSPATSSSARRTLPWLSASAVVERLRVDLVLVALERRAHRLVQFLVRRRPRREASARASGWSPEAAPRRSPISRNRVLRRRLLQRLQQRIRRVLVQLVGAIDDDHAPAPLARRCAEKGAQAPHLVDADPLRVTLRLLVPCAPDQQQIRMRRAPRPCGTRMLDRSTASALARLAPAPCARSDRRASPCRSPSGPTISQA